MKPTSMVGKMKSSKKLRVSCVGFFHETNTYLTEGMGETTLDTMRTFRGDEINALRETALGGAVDVCEENGWELLPGLIYAPDSTFSLVNAQAWRDAKKEMLDTLEAQMPLDIVYLALHGAGVVDKTPDLEGDFAESVRALVGKDTMIVWSGDLHGKITDKMKDNMNFFSACKEYPHLDMNACARDAMYRAAAILAGESHPTPAYRKVPLIMPVSNTEAEGTFANRLKEKCIEIEKRPGVLNCSVMHGFPYQDTDFCGVYPMVSTENNLELAQELVDELAQWIWDHREESFVPLNDLDETMSTVLAMLDRDGHYERKQPTKGDRIDHTPIVIGDAADNPGGGAGGSGTHLLRALLETKGLGKVAFISIHDPETAKAAVAAGVGTTIDVCLGGKFEPLAGEPIKTKAYVKSISDGNEFVRGGTAYGIPYTFGPTVRLVIADMMDVIVISGLVQTYDDSQARPHGIAIQEYDVIGVKSGNHFRAFYENFTDKLLIVDLPGATSRDITLFEHTQLKGAIYPLDENASFDMTN
jgi:microcystin degradation protein MlrC